MIAAFIALQTVLALVSIMVLSRRALPDLAALAPVAPESAGGLARSWLPVAVALPAIFSATAMTRPAARDAAVFAASSPAWSALVGIGVAMFVASAIRSGARDRTEGAASPASARSDRLAIAAAVAGGVVLLTAGLERSLTLFVGQAAFAILAVLLWIGSPAGPAVRAEQPHSAAESNRAAGALLMLLGLGLAEGTLARMSLVALASAAGDADGPTPAIVAIASLVALRTVVATAIVGSFASGGGGARTAVWIGAIGTCGSFGVPVVLQLPGMIAAAGGGFTIPNAVVAGGLGPIVAAGIGLVAAGAAIASRPTGITARVSGVLVLAGAGSAAATGLVGMLGIG